MKKLKLWQVEVVGAIFGSVAGAADHFFYDRTQWIWASVIAPINESPWEHLKLYFFPVMLFMIVEWFWVENKSKLLFTKTVQVVAGMAFILGFFYAYNAVLPDNALVDILSFFVAMVGGYWLSYRILKSSYEPRLPSWAWVTALVIICLVFQFMTWRPVHVPLFQDTETKTYGIARQL